jgi:hypothetical protein
LLNRRDLILTDIALMMSLIRKSSLYSIDILRETQNQSNSLNPAVYKMFCPLKIMLDSM